MCKPRFIDEVAPEVVSNAAGNSKKSGRGGAGATPKNHRCRSAKVCTNFSKQGRCKFGDSCKYIHEATHRESPAASTADPDTSSPSERSSWELDERRTPETADGWSIASDGSPSSGKGSTNLSLLQGDSESATDASAARTVAVVCPKPGLDKVADKVLRKTRMCRFHLQGSCVRGSNCGFAHDPSELQARPDLHHTRLCVAFVLRGKCRDGEACKYAHGVEHLRSLTCEPTAQLQQQGPVPLDEPEEPAPAAELIEDVAKSVPLADTPPMEDDSDFYSGLFQDYYQATGCHIAVKRTFVEVMESPKNKTAPRSRSAAPHFGRLSEDPESAY